MAVIKFKDLQTSDLIVDALYEGGKSGNASDEVLSKVLSVQNQSGFRFLGNAVGRFDIKYCVLYTTFTDQDWPDTIDYESGKVVYFGDNKKPGKLHETPKKGNVVLREIFHFLHLSQRNRICPFFIFSKAGTGRDVIFRGLAVPGYPGISQTEDLTAVWKTLNSSRFQNYKSIFTILDCPVISREWIKDLKNGVASSVHMPAAYKHWLSSGNYQPLKAKKTTSVRTKAQQIPTSKSDLDLISIITNFYKDPFKFEKFAVEITYLMDSNIFECDQTRPWRDGGRDAVGKYRIGLPGSYMSVDFALEAKRYGLSNGVGVKEVSRLISRLRHRQFGILVTSSYVDIQAYKEIVEDGHPVLILSAIDIVEILKKNGITTKALLSKWLAGI